MRPSPARNHLAAIALLVALLLAVRLGVANADNTTSQIASARAQISKSVGSIAAGLEQGLQKQDVRTAVRLHKIEQRATDLLVKTANAKYATPLNKHKAMGEARALLSRVYTLQERTMEHAVDSLDKALPGEPNRLHWGRAGKDLYKPLFRSATPGQAGPSGMDRYRQMLSDFQAKGGKASDFHTLGKQNLAKLDSGRLVEWTQFGKDTVRYTSAGAKHPVIGKGRSVRGAGSMKIFKDAKGEVILAVVTNASGNYKPAHSSTEGVVQKLRSLGVPASRILTTKMTPGEGDNVKLLLKSRGMPKDQIKIRVARLRDGQALGKLPRATIGPNASVKAKSPKAKSPKADAAKPVFARTGKTKAAKAKTTKNVFAKSDSAKTKAPRAGRSARLSKTHSRASLRTSRTSRVGAHKSSARTGRSRASARAAR